MTIMGNYNGRKIEYGQPFTLFPVSNKAYLQLGPCVTIIDIKTGVNM